jgi:N-carbamoyl-L-amino-acid hydrolase
MTWEDASDFLADFAELSAIGATARGGVERQAATAEDGLTRAWLTRWFDENGFAVRVDGIGNLIGLVEFDPDAPYVLVGSHLDSQPLAGRFDGAYGVLAGAHAVREARDRFQALGARPPFNLAVVDWFNEEGSRFKPSMMGSAVHIGRLPIETALATEDPRGVTVQQALQAIDGVGRDAIPEVASYAELHIEQGRSLEDDGITIGVVASTWSAHKYTVLVRGEQAHTGSAAMADRRDALLAASHLVVAVNELVGHFPVEQMHTSVGELYVRPNSPVVVAREVELLIDIRAIESTMLEEAFRLLEQRMREIDLKCGTNTEVVTTSVWGSGAFLEAGVELVEQSADALGLSHQRVLTLAGHDATNMKEQVPTVLMFVPSVAGISHSELEYTTDADLVHGLQLLADVVVKLASGALAGS